MLRKTLNASRLQEEVHRRIHKLQEVVEDGVKIGVPRPQLQEPDRSGCNWTMQHFHNAAGFEASVARVLEQVQAEYNIAQAKDEAVEDDVGQQAGTCDPFGGAKRAGAENPFGGSKPAQAANPFGVAGPSGKQDPFGDTAPASEDAPPAKGKRPANPFGD